ncbi:hypothetical protein BD309DRAFT_416364 [Dichomitus squalens]|nr:hypothetical protein BD309DRAFT_416364 [Dichomitus squalens]
MNARSTDWDAVISTMQAINTLVALHQVMPEHLREAKPLRDTRRPPAEWDRRGAALFSAVYRDTAPSVESLLDAAYPDLGWFCTTVGYGMTYGGTDVLSVVELVYVMVAALIAVDAPRQVGWHLANARRGARGGAGGEGHRHPGGGEGGGEVAKRRPGGGGVKRGDAGEEGGGPVRWGPVRCTDGLSVRVPRMVCIGKLRGSAPDHEHPFNSSRDEMEAIQFCPSANAARNGC